MLLLPTVHWATEWQAGSVLYNLPVLLLEEKTKHRGKLSFFFFFPQWKLYFQSWPEWFVIQHAGKCSIKYFTWCIRGYEWISTSALLGIPSSLSNLIGKNTVSFPSPTHGTNAASVYHKESKFYISEIISEIIRESSRQWDICFQNELTENWFIISRKYNFLYIGTLHCRCGLWPNLEATHDGWRCGNVPDFYEQHFYWIEIRGKSMEISLEFCSCRFH